MDARESWEFAVVGCDSNDFPHYIGFVSSLEDARKLQRNAEAIGWRRVAVFDAALTEVREKEQQAHE